MKPNTKNFYKLINWYVPIQVSKIQRTLYRNDGIFI